MVTIRVILVHNQTIQGKENETILLNIDFLILVNAILLLKANNIAPDVIYIFLVIFLLSV